MKAGNAHGLHSPFVYDLYTQAIRSKEGLNLHDIEEHRKIFLNTPTEIDFKELGAGSQLNVRKQRSISSIAKYSLSNHQKCALLYRIVKFLKPKYLLELGTSLGIATAYMARATEYHSFVSIEGDPEISKLAAMHLEDSIHTINAPFEDALPEVMNAVPYIDFAFIDGHHTRTATLKYFDVIINRSNDYSCLVFDDIYWNPDMHKAWQEIISDQRVSISIDLFHLGLVFTRPFQPKQHFQLRTGVI